jgi:tRNA threonylcarbamoyladenosine biosynthesis protein TsaB
MEQLWRIAIETSGRKGSAAIGTAGELLAEQEFATDTEHARDLLPVVQELLTAQGATAGQIEHCYVSIGPGSFTGLRVAVTFARHLALAVGAKIVAVPTLDAIAMNALATSEPPQRLAIILDAKRKQVFGAAYQRTPEGSYAQVIAPCLIEPGQLFLQARSPLAVSGEGIAYHRDAVAAAGVEVLDETFWFPRAARVFAIGSAMAASGQFTAPTDLIPLYIRRPEAEEVWEKRHGSPTGPA